MPETIADLWVMPGLWWLVFAAFMAGIVRGFTGFGTAMVYLPVAGQFLSPFEALTTMLIKDLVGPLIHVPRALKDGHPRDVIRLGVGALLAVPLGVLVLSLVAPEVFRWGVSIMAMLLLVLLIGGVHYVGKLTPPMIVGAGAMGGFLAGSVGLPGPPVIMLYMASPLPVSAVRANLTLYLILADLILLAVLWAGGHLVAVALLLGLSLIAPYLFGIWVGGILFRPEAERVYRIAAYIIIAGSAILGLPILD